MMRPPQQHWFLRLHGVLPLRQQRRPPTPTAAAAPATLTAAEVLHLVLSAEEPPARPEPYPLVFIFAIVIAWLIKAALALLAIVSSIYAVCAISKAIAIAILPSLGPFETVKNRNRIEFIVGTPIVFGLSKLLPRVVRKIFNFGRRAK